MLHGTTDPHPVYATRDDGPTLTGESGICYDVTRDDGPTSGYMLLGHYWVHLHSRDARSRCKKRRNSRGVGMTHGVLYTYVLFRSCAVDLLLLLYSFALYVILAG